MQIQKQILLKNQQPSQHRDSLVYTNRNHKFGKSNKTSQENALFYKNLFKNVAIHQKLQNYLDSLLKNKIYYSKDNCYHTVKINKINKTNNLKIIALLVSFSYFTFQIIILNLSKKTLSFNQLKVLGSGANGSVFLSRDFQGEMFAIKNIKYYQAMSNKPYQRNFKAKQTQENLKKIIIQYCIYKLCSALKIGPKVKNYLGFDLIVYNETAQFSMQLCIKKQPTQFSGLKQSLYLLHTLQIIHGDIKPQNILWSLSYNKFVFIDFGFSTCLSQLNGQKSETTYFGTYAYCCPDMQKLYSQRSTCQIDLYYNDTYCLHQTIKRQQDRFKPINQKNQNNIINVLYQQQNNKQDIFITPQYRQFLFNITLQHLIFDKDLKKVNQLCQKSNYAYQLFPQTKQLLFEIKSSKKILQIIKFLQKNYELPIKWKQQKLYFYRIQNIIQKQINERDKQNFIERIKQSNGINYSFNDFIQFIKFFFKQDISPRDNILKQKLKKSLKTNLYSQFSKKYWINFQIYISNLFTTSQQILSIFQHLKHNLQIKSWQQPQNPQFLIPLRAHQIWKAVLIKYGYDLCGLQHAQKFYRCYTYSLQLIEQQKEQQQPFRSFMQYSKQIFQFNDFHNDSFIVGNEKKRQILKAIKQKIILRTKQNKRPLNELFIQYIDYLCTKSEVQVMKLGYEIIEKLSRFQTATKCHLMYTLQIKQLNNVLFYSENHNQNFFDTLIQVESLLYNYCLKPEYMAISYFCINIIFPLSKLKDLKNRRHTISIEAEIQNICCKLIQYIQLYKNITKYQTTSLLRFLRILNRIISQQFKVPSYFLPISKIIENFVQNYRKQPFANKETGQLYLFQKKYNFKKQNFFSLQKINQHKTKPTYEQQYFIIVYMIDKLQKNWRNNIYCQQTWNCVRSIIDSQIFDSKQITQQKLVFLVTVIGLGIPLQKQIPQLDDYAESIQRYINKKITQKNFAFNSSYYSCIKQTLCHHYMKKYKSLKKSLQILIQKKDNNFNCDNNKISLYVLSIYCFNGYLLCIKNFNLLDFSNQITHCLNKSTVGIQNLNRTETICLIECLLTFYIINSKYDQDFKRKWWPTVLHFIKIASYFRYAPPQFAWSSLINKIIYVTTMYLQIIGLGQRKGILTYLKFLRNKQYPFPICDKPSRVLFNSHIFQPQYQHHKFQNQRISPKIIVRKIKRKIHQINQNKLKFFPSNQNKLSMNANLFQRIHSIINQENIQKGLLGQRIQLKRAQQKFLQQNKK